MNSAMSNRVGGLLTTSTKKETSDGHRRNASVDSGHFDMSTIIDGSLSEHCDSAESAMTDLSQADHGGAVVHYKLAKSQIVRHGSALSNQSIDSGVGGSLSQESIELDHDEHGSMKPPSTSSELETVDEREMDEGDQLQPKGEDYTDLPESMYSEAVRRFRSPLVEVISNQVTVDRLASDLYSHSLIENTIYEKVRVQGVTNETKTYELLDAVMSKLRTSCTVKPFEIFLEVLDSHQSCVDLVVQIKAVYQELHQNCEISFSGRHNTYVHHQYARHEFVCGLCGNNSIAGIVSHGSLQSLVGEKPSGKQPIPYVGAPESLVYQHQGLKRSAFSRCRQRSLSESDADLTEEEIQEELMRWQEEQTRCQEHGKRLERWIRNYMDKKQEDNSTMKERVRHLELMVQDLQTQLDSSTKKLDICNEEKQVIEKQFSIAQRQILQLNKQVVQLKRPKQCPCDSTCEHKAKCEQLEKQIQRLEETILDHTATIGTLTQQIDLLLN